MRAVRIALVTPYSWTYPGGVNRHVEALATEFLARGHDLRVLAPWDPPDRLTRVLHRADPEERERPGYLRTLGRSMAFGMNGSVSNNSPFPGVAAALRRELDEFEPDVVHVHEPPAGFIGWDACSYGGAPVVATFHAYSTKAFPNWLANLAGARRKFNQLNGRIAVSEAAAWTGKRWFGGDYRIVPNGVDLDAPPAAPKPPSDELRVLFVGRPEERKGLPVLLQAFEALVEHVPVAPGDRGRRSRRRRPVPRRGRGPRCASTRSARVDHDELWRQLHEADVLCAPSLSGESFGMVLTEAFAAGTPVIASHIAGYADVVTDGVDGVLVPPADPQRLAEELQAMYHEPERRSAMGEAARHSAERYAWPRVAEQVEAVYRDAIAAPQPEPGLPGLPQRAGLVADRRLTAAPGAAAGVARPRARRAWDPRAARTADRARVAALLGVGLSAIAANRIGLDEAVESIVRSDLSWVLVATALMIASLFMRAVSWFAIARSALPRHPLRRRDVASATMVGVLMSATLPARLGEPARAMVLARRTGRMRETFPVLLGTLVSQSVLNIFALVILGAIIVGSTDLFHARTERLFLISLAPLGILLAVILAPTLVRQNGTGRTARMIASIRGALLKVREGLVVFRDPRRGPVAALAQLGAWGLQLLACFVLFTALGLDHQASIGIGAAAAALFAVNVTAVVPATPSNIGVFQLAVISVLTTGFGVSASDALAYGVVLQAVEIATAVALGLPALVREGVTWSDMRMRALSTAPVRLSPRQRDRATETVS